MYRPGRIQSHLVPAIGPAERRTSNPVTPSTSGALGDLPPSPAPPPPRPQFVLPAVLDVREKHDAQLLRPQVLSALEEVEALWAVESTPEGEGESDTAGLRRDMDDPVDVLHSLLRTTNLVRSVRNYLLMLPSSANSPPPPPQMSTFRPNNLTPQPVPRQRISPGSSITSNTGSAPTDPSARIRRAALDLLSQLRLLEESSRLGPAHGIDFDEHDHDASSDISSLGVPRALSPASGGSSRGPSPLPPYELDQAEDDGEEKKREGWDERLVLGGGFLYRTDVRLADCELERDAVRKYLKVVDEVLFDGGKEDGKRGWRRPEKDLDTPAQKRRVSASGLAARRPPASPAGSRRVVSAAGALESSLGRAFTEEPESVSLTGGDIDSLALGGITEGDEEEEPVGTILEEEEEEEEEQGNLSFMSQDESSLPNWAQTAAFDTLAGRVHALLKWHLPTALQEHLPPPSPSDAFWLGLQSGQLLCVAYNAAVRRSSKPWGYIESRAIHDIIALDLAASQPPPPPPEAPAIHPLHHAIGPQFTGRRQQRSPEPQLEPLLPQSTGGASKKEGGWTFRRTENLRLFAAACKLRYLIPFVNVIPGPAPGGKTVDAVQFDPKIIANKADAWQSMLETGVSEWLDRVVQERKEESGGR
ncbi:hypothetical protein CALVIDRAFT_85676 [Calocera viscosa TUFC12733]|uniref:Uncharacterized protein n=1 Tax=Calocera viscosa (strain TUFC12733) TaxID=1330018 RepID=A0A167N4N8_CALVF|nr:hypothetical protein CALVIDRAFT_85676 [Calocera viscosa TUFC12733]